MAITRSQKPQGPNSTKRFLTVVSNPVKLQRRKQKAFEQSRSAAVLNGRLRHGQDNKVGRKVVVTSTTESQKTSGGRGKKDGSVWSGRLRGDSSIASSQFRSGRKRSSINRNDTSNTKLSKKIKTSPSHQSRNTKPPPSAAQNAHLQNLWAKRRANQVARAAAEAQAATVRAAARAAARATAAAAQAVALEAAARAQREALEADMRTVVELWENVVDEMSVSKGTSPITDEDRRDAQEILARFSSTVSTGVYFITKLERMYNAKLEKQFAATKEKFRKDPEIVSDLETMMFHGTAPYNVGKIMKGGFKIGGVNGHRAVHGTSWGCGVYTNNNPSNSFGYCGHGGEQSNQIIALRCLPGRYGDWTGGRWIGPGGLNLDLKPDDQSVGSPTSILVLKSSEQCLPLYVVHYSYKTQLIDPRAFTMKSFRENLESSPKIVFTKVHVGGGK